MMTNELKVFCNGSFKLKSEATTSIFDHGLLYGDGIFEGIRAYNGHVFKLKEHIDRLFESAKMINLDIDLIGTKEEIINIVRATLRVNKLNDAYIRLIITRGVGELGLDPKNCKEPNIFVITQPMEPIANPKGITAITVGNVRRIPHSAFSPNIKSLNYLNNILCKMQASMVGKDEGIFLDVDGNVAEGSAENIFIVKDNILITPPHIISLKGITRQTILDQLYRFSYHIKGVEIRNISVFELYTADEIFLTGTAAEIAPIIEIDGRIINDGKPGKVTLDLQEAFKEFVTYNNNSTKIWDE